MKKQSVIFVIGLMPLIPCSSRFAYAILLCAEIWLLFGTNLLAYKIIELIDIKGLYAKKAFSLMLTVSFAIIFSQATAILFPITELSLRFYIYLTAFTYILRASLENYLYAYQSFSLISFYSIFMLCFSFLRELILFGTISFIIPSGLFSIKIIPDNFLALRFLGTNAGALILLGISAWFYFSIRKAELIPFTEEQEG